MRILFIASTLLVTLATSAEPTRIELQRISSETNIEAALASAKSHASTTIKGMGDVLEIGYDATAAMTLFVLPLNTKREFDPLNALVAILPEGRNDVSLRISSSPDWLPGEQSFILHILSEDEEGAAIQKLTLKAASLWGIIGAGVEQFMLPEPFTPSSYHRIRGPRVFGTSVTAIAGVALIAGTAFLVARGKRRIALFLLVTVTLVWNLRFSIDTTRFAFAHTEKWFSDRTYAAAGSVYDIAATLENLDAGKTILCSDGTSYVPTIFQYALGKKQRESKGATHVVVMGAYDWSFDGTVLRCHADSWQAKEIQKFPDGSILFAIQ